MRKGRSTLTRAILAKQFRSLHSEGTFVLANAWDAISAAVIAAAGARAIATTSSGVSWAHGVPDGENLTREQSMAAVARIVRAVDVPVTADIEAGYGPTRQDVSDTLEAVLEAGAVGVNIEDRRRDASDPLWSLESQCERLTAARRTADRHEPLFTINARTDVFLAAVGDAEHRLEMTLERGRAYAEAGADCLFVPGLTELDTIRQLVRSVPLPLNILLAPGSGPSITELSDAGVRRISVGSLIAAAAYGTVREAARALLAGDAEPLTHSISHAEMQGLANKKRPGGDPMGAIG